MTISITFSHDDEDVLARWTGLGRPMTPQEINLDLFNIKTAVEELQDNYTATISIDTITQPSPSTMRVTKTDATFSDINLPIGRYRSRKAWVANTAYLENDTVTANGAYYLVLLDHTSADTFDPNANDGMGHDYYDEMIPSIGNALPAGGAPRMKLQKSTSSDYAVTWGFDIASDVVFTPSTGSALSSDNVAAALEELETLIASSIDDVVVIASDVTFTPPTGSELVSSNVADALVELETLIADVTVDAVDVTFAPPTGSALSSTNVADALVELETLDSEKLPLAGGTMTGAIVLAADPAAAMQPATKQYVDGLALNLGKRGRVRVLDSSDSDPATSGYTNGATIDGVTLATGDLVLRNASGHQARNGVWVVATSGGAARSSEYDTYDEHPGSLLAVEEGTTNADTLWLCTSNAGGTLNSTAIAFSAASAGGGLLAANNLSDLASASTARTNLGLGSISTFDESTAAQYRANTASKALSTDKVWSAADLVALTDAATIAVDMSTFFNASVTLGGNRTLGNPSNTKNGQGGVIKLVQDGTGSRTLAYASNWKFAGGTAPTLTTTASAVDLLFYQVISSTFIYATLVADVK